jgi:hypothetical protein
VRRCALVACVGVTELRTGACYCPSSRSLRYRDKKSFSRRVAKMMKLASDSVAKITSPLLEVMDKFISLCHDLRKLLFDALD